MLHDTLRGFPDVYHNDGKTADVAHLTYTCMATWGAVDGCLGGAEACGALPLFDAHAALFGRNVHFLDSPTERERREIKRMTFKTLVIGTRTRCSVVAESGINTTDCHKNLEMYRRRMLRLHGLHDRAVSREDLRCPRVVLLDRVGAKWRRLHNQDAVLAALKSALPSCATITRVTFSKKVALRDQIWVVLNSTVVMAGRGAASSLFPFLPRGGVYVSFSSDRWNPFRDIEPVWVRKVVHRFVKPVHHARADLPPQRFSFGVDTNRCGYLEESPTGFAKAVMNAL